MAPSRRASSTGPPCAEAARVVAMLRSQGHSVPDRLDLAGIDGTDASCGGDLQAATGGLALLHWPPSAPEAVLHLMRSHRRMVRGKPRQGPRRRRDPVTKAARTILTALDPTPSRTPTSPPQPSPTTSSSPPDQTAGPGNTPPWARSTGDGAPELRERTSPAARTPATSSRWGTPPRRRPSWRPPADVRLRPPQDVATRPTTPCSGARSVGRHRPQDLHPRRRLDDHGPIRPPRQRARGHHARQPQGPFGRGTSALFETSRAGPPPARARRVSKGRDDHGVCRRGGGGHPISPGEAASRLPPRPQRVHVAPLHLAAGAPARGLANSCQ